MCVYTFNYVFQFSVYMRFLNVEMSGVYCTLWGSFPSVLSDSDVVLYFIIFP